MKVRTVKFNGGGSAEINIAECPFCGADPVVIHQGNAHTKSQAIIIKCPECRIERTDKVIRHTIEWLLPKSVASWNRRPKADELCEERGG